MATRQISRLALAPDLRDRLIANNLLTVRDVLLLSPLDLVELIGLTWNQAKQLLANVSAQIAPPYCTAWDALSRLTAQGASPPLRFGLATLDSALRLGVPGGSITELVGPGGVGKSQMCHSLALMAAAPITMGGLERGAIYIDTERKFSPERLAEMLAARVRCNTAPAAAAIRPAGSLNAGGGGGSGSGGGSGLQGLDCRLVSEVLQRVVVCRPGSTGELARVLENLPGDVLLHKARLIVIDSIAALARTEYGNTAGGDGSSAGGGGLLGSIMDRQQLLGRLADRLKSLAESLQVPVVVTNQVTTRFSTPTAHQPHQPQQPSASLGTALSGSAGGRNPILGGASGGVGGGGDEGRASGSGVGGALTAALGTRWAHCVNTRLVFERLNERRFCKVAKSPSCANVVLEYVIGPTGLEQVDRAGELPATLRGNVLEAAIYNEVDYGGD